MESLLRGSNIEKTYTLDKGAQESLHVLKGIDLDVIDGEVVSVVGASGSGKSTLLHILGGLDRPTKGEVFWSGKNIFSLSDDALAHLRTREVGFVFQFHHLLPEFTALENVMIPLMIAQQPVEQASASAARLLERVGLAGRMSHKPNELSGGEQQRIAVARALANAPRIILADEPTGNLDSANSQQIFDLILQLNLQEKQTFVIVTHNELFAEKSHRKFRMVDGKLSQL